MSIPSNLRQWIIEEVLKDGGSLDLFGIEPGDASYVMEQFDEEIFANMFLTTLESSPEAMNTAIASAITFSAFVGYTLRMKREKEETL